MSNIKIPGYRILKQLGQGGMSSVFLAEQLSFGRNVAVKVMSQQLAAKEHFGDRFLREARIAAQLSHPNIVSVYDTGCIDGAYFLAMEYLPGGHLGQRMNTGVALLESLDIIEDAAYALDHAASQNVVHRDIKPGNIMFRADGSLALVDFGIARDLSTETMVTQAGTVLGTPHYMSPEQSLGETLDNRSDLYSLGIVFFELLTGHVPFTADSAAAVGVKHLSEAVPRLPEELDIFQPIVDTLLAKAPEDRYQTGADMIADLLALREEIPHDLQTTILTSNAFIFDTSSLKAPASGPRSRRTKRRSSRSSSAKRRRTLQRRAASIGAVLFAAGAGYYLLAPGGLLNPDAASPGTRDPQEPVAAQTHSPGPPSAVPLEGLPDPLALEAAAEDDEGRRLEELAVQYIDSANRALDDSLLQQAQNFIDLAVALTPTEPKSTQALAQVIARSATVGQQEKQLADSRERFARQLERGDFYSPADANAYTSLAALETLAPGRDEWTALRREVDNGAVREINTLLSTGELDRAAAAIEALGRHAGPELLAPLTTRLDTLQRGRDVRRARVADLSAEARRLEAAGDRDSINGRLLMVYKEILSLDSANRAARKGMQRSTRFALDSSEEAMAAGELDQAKTLLGQLDAAGYSGSDLDPLQSRLRTLTSRRAQATTALAQARQRLDQMDAGTLDASPDTSDITARTAAYVDVFRALRKARDLDANARRS